ncbi:putative MFS-type transporter PB1E7.08c [Lasiodiplodia hormozganensis]|uniref:MFS-type transporter PB1E7.08c n=1 Tax=Lasiodiplodia hormozganensis TaxID=869390 RepID=A0AA39Z072_9PEZI|nr:putative MFS-type transporter PB1E7.08c [Lasiodiplodia hormozganensis]
MSSDDIKEEKGHEPTSNALTQTASYGEGKVQDIDDPAVRDFYGNCLSDSYRLKSELVSKHLTEIGMGKYQWLLFVVTGFGWIADNFWSQGISTVQPAMAMEFSDISKRSYSSVAYYVGLILGASFWGISADFIGRKPAFNATIMIGGIFGCAVAGSQNFIAFSAMWAVIGTAAGGNVPVDSMIFLEFVPGSHQWLLTALSAWWNFGQVIVSLIGWVFLANYSCPSGSDYTTCSRSDNMGWRYTMITLGALAMAFGIIRIFVFKMPESPRYLLSKGRDAEAVEAVNYIARYNGKPETLTLAMLHDIDVTLGIATTDEDAKKGLSRREIIRENLKDYKGVNYKNLFATRKFALHTSLTWLIWLTIGIAYPLYFGFLPSYLETKFSAATSLSKTYRNYCIVSSVGILGPISAGFLVETPRFGRRWMMGLSAILTGVFLFAYTAARTETQDLAFQCVTGILGNFEYAVMYAFTPESFPGPLRGTGTGTAATLLRFGGLVASLVSANVGFSTVPIYVSAALWVAVGVVCFGLPFETHGHAAV